MSEYYVNQNAPLGAMNANPPAAAAPAFHAPMANAAPTVYSAPAKKVYPSAVMPVSTTGAAPCGYPMNDIAILVLFILLVIITRLCLR